MNGHSFIHASRPLSGKDRGILRSCTSTLTPAGARLRDRKDQFADVIALGLKPIGLRGLPHRERAVDYRGDLVGVDGSVYRPKRIERMVDVPDVDAVQVPPPLHQQVRIGIRLRHFRTEECTLSGTEQSSCARLVDCYEWIDESWFQSLLVIRAGRRT